MFKSLLAKKRQYVTIIILIKLFFVFITFVSVTEDLSLERCFLFLRELLQGEKRYLTGLDQLAIASKSVAALQVALEILQPKLAAGAAAVAETTAKVEKEKEGVALIEADVLKDQAAAEKQVR